MDPSTSLAVPACTSLSLQVRSVDDLQRLARLFAASGLFARSSNPDASLAQCAVQLLAGMEAGMTPFAAITNVYVVNGRPGFSAQALAQAIKRHPLYDYRVLAKTADECRIRFMAGREELGIETFTMAMAERAGLVKGGPWKQYPEAMLFARCLTAGMRTHCPDALGGHSAYTPEELGAAGAIDENGMVTVQEVPPAPVPMLSTKDELLGGAERACEASGLTAAGTRAFALELSKGESDELADLPANVLARIAKSGVSSVTVERCNGTTVVPDEDEDDEPIGWLEPAA